MLERETCFKLICLSNFQRFSSVDNLNLLYWHILTEILRTKQYLMKKRSDFKPGDSFILKAGPTSILFFIESVTESKLLKLKLTFLVAGSLLYDWSGLHLDHRTDQQIWQLTQAFSHIRRIFTFFTVHAPPTTERGESDVPLH